MAIAGKVMPRPRGDYDPAVVYDVLDMVTHDNNLWISKLSNNVGNVPSEEDTINWMLAVKGGLTVVDGVLTVEAEKGSYEIQDSSGKNAFLKKNTDTDTVEVGLSDDPDNVQQISVSSASTDINDAVKLERRVNDEYTAYRMYGEHNKPSGYYVGNGDPTYREITIVDSASGGVSTMILLSSDTGMVLVSNRGGIAKYANDNVLTGIPQQQMMFFSGKLYINSADDLLNKADQQYWYQVL